MASAAFARVHVSMNSTYRSTCMRPQAGKEESTMQEYPDFSDSGKSPAKIGSLMIGAILGAGIALLLAQAHGKDTRRRVGSTVKRLGQNAGHVFKRTRDQIGKVKNDAKSAIDKGRQEYLRSKDQPGIRTSSPVI